MKDAQENVDEIDIPISDDEEEEFHENFRENEFEDERDIKTKSTSHAEQQPGDNSKNIVTNSSTVTNNSWGAFDLEGDDEIQSVKIRKEMPNEDTNKIEVNDFHYTLLPISRHVLDETFQRNAPKFAIFHITNSMST